MRDILVRSRIWLSAPVDFNDPFDMSAKLIAEGPVAVKRERLKEILKSQGIMWGKIQKILPSLVTKPEGFYAEQAQIAYKNQTKSIGVYSFGGDPLERARDLTTFAQAIPVEYNDEYPMINWFIGFREGLEKAIEKSPIAKSCSRASVDWEARVLAKKVPPQPMSRPSALRLMPPSNRAASS